MTDFESTALGGRGYHATPFIRRLCSQAAGNYYAEKCKQHTLFKLLAQIAYNRYMDLVPRSNLWLERDGQVVLSRWRVSLLEAIASTGSISAAAERLGIDYRRAWDRLEEMEQRLGVALVERRAGGTGGGGARLTDAGQDYVTRFNRFAHGIDEVIASQFQDAFGE